MEGQGAVHGVFRGYTAFVSCSSSWGTLSSSCFLLALKGDVVLRLALPPPSPSHLTDTSPFCFASPPKACCRGGGPEWRWKWEPAGGGGGGCVSIETIIGHSPSASHSDLSCPTPLFLQVWPEFSSHTTGPGYPQRCWGGGLNLKALGPIANYLALLTTQLSPCPLFSLSK